MPGRVYLEQSGGGGLAPGQCYGGHVGAMADGYHTKDVVISQL